MEGSAPQSILVTGGTGFIGNHLVQRLLARGDRVSCLVRSTSNANLPGAQLILCDITDPKAVARAVAQSDAKIVFHLAGVVKALTPAEFMRVNADGTASVAAACAAQLVPPILLLVSSLAAVGPSLNDHPHSEAASPAPISNYGKSKLAGEAVAAQFAEEVPITIVRPSVVFGPGDRGVLEIFKPIARSGVHVVPWDTQLRVSAVHVADVVECLLLAAQKGERLALHTPGQGVYFVADEHLTYIELGNAIAAALDQKPPHVVRMLPALMKLTGVMGDWVSHLRRRAGWVGSDKISDVLAGSWTCSSTKARTQLNWSPAAPLSQRLRETARAYRLAGWI